MSIRNAGMSKAAIARRGRLADQQNERDAANAHIERLRYSNGPREYAQVAIDEANRRNAVEVGPLRRSARAYGQPPIAASQFHVVPPPPPPAAADETAPERRVREIMRERNCSYTQAVYYLEPELGAAHRLGVLSAVDAVLNGTARTASQSGPSPIVLFDNLIQEIGRQKPSLSYTDAVIEAANRNPELAAARNAAVTVAVGPGGVPVRAAGESKTSGTVDAIRQFDSLVDAKRVANPALSFVDAIKLAQDERPDLATARNAQISSGIVSL